MARAGHLEPLVVHPDGRARPAGVPAGPPLGLGGLPYEKTEIRLPPGSSIVLSTDGLLEERQRDIDEAVERLRGVVAHAGRTPEQMCQAVRDALLPAAPRDDVALLVARTRLLDGDRTALRQVESDPAAVSGVRACVSGMLHDRELEAEAFTLELILSELVTDTIRYATGPITVRVIRDRQSDLRSVRREQRLTASVPRRRHGRGRPRTLPRGPVRRPLGHAVHTRGQGDLDRAATARAAVRVHPAPATAGGAVAFRACGRCGRQRSRRADRAVAGDCAHVRRGDECREYYSAKPRHITPRRALMADNHDETTSLRPLYAARLAEDLKHNTEEQERIGSEVIALQEKLESLRHDHALLLTMQQALGAAGPAAEAASASAPTASVPRQAAPAAAQDAEPKKKARARKSTSSPKAESSVKAASSAETASASKAAAASKPASKTAAKKAPAAKQAPRNSDGPTLRDLVVGHLTREGEPRSALEVTDALTGSHPERGAKITVVRSTLEALVAKGQVRRSKQGKSVFYSTESVPAAADEKQPAAV
jgi:hypothetical protein